MIKLADLEGEHLIPIYTNDEEGDQQVPAGTEEIIPILPVRNTVLFPNVVIPITVGRKSSVRLVKKAYEGNKLVGVLAQKDVRAESPGEEELYTTGTVAKILQMVPRPDGNTTIIIQGQYKFELLAYTSREPFLKAKVVALLDASMDGGSKETDQLMNSLKEAALEMLKLNPEIPQEAQVAVENITDPNFLTCFLSSNIQCAVEEKQSLLEHADSTVRAKSLLKIMLREIQLLEIKMEIHSKVHSDIDQQQRDYFLRQQMKVLQDELGVEGADQELDQLKVRAKKKDWPKDIAEHFEKEVNKLPRMNPASAEYPILYSYCEFLLDLPWNKFSKDQFDLEKAHKILNKDHFGLEKVKERILEYLAVLKLKNDMKGPILCLYGPPGVGKTSLGKSIAKALGRKYVRLSLGGVRDEAEIRGHRKTYVGAMPGKIVQHIKKGGTSNPLFVLDELDKIGADFRGDPASAFLEVLDPEQNHSFTDNYLEVPYDLSKVLFVATANTLDTLHPALRDRMEIIQLSGYTLEEKLQIARKFLLPKQRKEHGLTAKQLALPDGVIKAVVQGYTRESGVRQLERKVATLARKAAKAVVSKQEYTAKVNETQLHEWLGKPDFDNELYEEEKVAGVAVGLAWTSVGGEILFIEGVLSRGNGKVILSGQLGDVMKESATTALSWLKSRAAYFKLDYRIFQQYDLHLHIPAGAVPKDGPSAGITLLTTMVSLYTQRRVKPKLAMTAEMTLRGKLLPVGGIKEKLLAAKRAGIKEIIFCDRNLKDVEEIEEVYKKGLKLHFLKTAEAALEVAIEPEKLKNALDFPIEEKKS
jgi:ATP-dependent Lon protease